MLLKINNIYIITLFLFLFCRPVFANEIANDYFEGRVYLVNGDTLKTKIHLSFYRGNFVKKLYADNFGHYLDKNNKVKGLNPNKINGFELNMDNKRIVFVSKFILPSDKKKTFFRLLNNISDPVVLYEYYDFRKYKKSAGLGGLLGGAIGGGVAAAIAAEETQALYRIEYNLNTVYYPRRHDFKNDKIAYILSDYKELESKIRNNDYKYDDIPSIIEEYNQWYTLKNR